MIHLSLFALAIVLIGLHCKQLTAPFTAGIRDTDILTPERMRALLEQARREYPAQERA
jgi:hypothetical protein